MGSVKRARLTIELEVGRAQRSYNGFVFWVVLASQRTG
jgi:hypothetical protein